MFLLRALTVSGPIISQRIIVRRFIAIEPSLALSSRLGQYRRLSQWPSEESEESEAVHSKELVCQIKKDSNAKDQELHELTSSETQVATTPWYLRDGTHPKLELSERQRIPDLPESPPPIIQPLMQQLSVDLGLDDLSLLDLRKLDPPPALGANLLMLLATARSEKHLHVSADRLCRWLRINYQLRPDADGLLGRSELKTRLKRKAKKTKLLGSHNEDPDDGIRSGWICVDAGIVKDAKNREQVTPSRDFIGFGRRTEGVRIVIQMLTEEKRDEINLEGLWSGILKRSEQEDVLDHDVEESFLTGREIIQTIQVKPNIGPLSAYEQERN